MALWKCSGRVVANRSWFYYKERFRQDYLDLQDALLTPGISETALSFNLPPIIKNPQRGENRWILIPINGATDISRNGSTVTIVSREAPMQRIEMQSTSENASTALMEARNLEQELRSKIPESTVPQNDLEELRIPDEDEIRRLWEALQRFDADISGKLEALKNAMEVPEPEPSQVDWNALLLKSTISVVLLVLEVFGLWLVVEEDGWRSCLKENDFSRTCKFKFLSSGAAIFLLSPRILESVWICVMFRRRSGRKLKFLDERLDGALKDYRQAFQLGLIGMVVIIPTFALTCAHLVLLLLQLPWIWCCASREDWTSIEAALFELLRDCALMVDVVSHAILAPLAVFIILSSDTASDVVVNIIAVEAFAYLDDTFVKIIYSRIQRLGDVLKRYEVKGLRSDDVEAAVGHS